MYRFLLPLFLLTTAAHAVPTLYNKCANVQLRPVPGGAGVYFSDDCKTAYVLPPTSGRLSISGMAPSANLERCSVMNSFINIMKSQAARLEELADQANRASANGKSTGTGLGTGTADSGSLGLGRDSTLFPPGDSGATPATSTADLDREVLDTSKLFSDINLTLKEYWMMEGATGQAVFDADQQALVAAYQAKNPKIHFEAFTVASARINFARKVTANTASIPAVLSFEIPGIKGTAAFPAPEESDGGVMFGGATAGQLVLSMVGACPLYNAVTHEMKQDKLNGKTLSGYFAAHVDYTYNVAVNRRYTAKYNLANFIKRVQSSESHGGFFTTSTVNRLIIEKKSDDWFEFESHDEDPRHAFEDNLRETVKAQLIDRVFRQIELLTVGGPEKYPAQIDPKANGAQVGAEALHKCPYVYCQVTAVLLDVGNAIFGGSESVAEFIQNNNFWATDKVSESRTIPFVGSVIFEDRT